VTRRDVLVIVVIVAIVVVVTVPALYRVRISSRRVLCEKRQIELAEAVQRFEAAQQRLPGYRDLQAIDAEGRRRPASWVFAVLPYLEYAGDSRGERPFAYVDLQYGPRGGDETRGLPPEVYVPALVCPADAPHKGKPPGAWLSFVANAGMPDAPRGEFPPDWPANGPFLDHFAVPPAGDVSVAWLDAHDGAGQTLMLSENLDANRWTDTDEARVGFVWVENLVDGEPDPDGLLHRINEERGSGDGSIDFARPSSNHPGGVNVMYCDGRSEFLTEEIDYLVLVRLMTPDDLSLTRPGSKEPVQEPFRFTPEDRLPKR